MKVLLLSDLLTTPSIAMKKWKAIEVRPELLTDYQKKFIPAGRYWFTQYLSDTDKLKLGAKYAKRNGSHYGWLVPLEEWSARFINGAQLSPWPKIQFEEPFETEKDFPSFHRINSSLPPEDKAHLRTYQINFFKEVKTFLKNGMKYSKSLIAPLGAGKTIMGLGALHLANTKSLVVAPKYLHDQWRREAEKWGFEIPHLITYAHETVSKYLNLGYKAVIFDENLRTKNPRAQRSKTCQKLANSCKLAIGMTATPTSSEGAADWRHINTGHPGALPQDKGPLMHTFGIAPTLDWIPGRREKTWVIKGWDDEAVAEFIEPYVYTVARSDIQAHIPSVHFIKIHLEQPPVSWLEAREGLYTDLSFSKAIAQCRQLTSGFYTDDDKEVYDDNNIKLNWIKDFIADNPNEGIVIFSTHIEAQRRLEKGLAIHDPAVIVADGRDTGADLRRFQEGRTKIMVCSAQLTEGMNLHKVCRIGIFESNGLSPVMRKQAVGRIERPNSNWAGVTIYDLCCQDTFDEHLLDLLTKHINFSENQILELLRRKW